MNKKIFKTCPKCNHTWNNVDELCNDIEVQLKGYQASNSNPLEGYFLFIHNNNECTTSLTIKVTKFFSIMPQEEIDKIKPFIFNKTEDCMGYCQNIFNLKTCDSQICKGKILRDLLAKIAKCPGKTFEK